MLSLFFASQTYFSSYMFSRLFSLKILPHDLFLVWLYTEIIKNFRVEKECNRNGTVLLSWDKPNFDYDQMYMEIECACSETIDLKIQKVGTHRCIFLHPRMPLPECRNYIPIQLHIFGIMSLTYRQCLHLMTCHISSYAYQYICL